MRDDNVPGRSALERWTRVESGLDREGATELPDPDGRPAERIRAGSVRRPGADPAPGCAGTTGGGIRVLLLQQSAVRAFAILVSFRAAALEDPGLRQCRGISGRGAHPCALPAARPGSKRASPHDAPLPVPPAGQAPP